MSAPSLPVCGASLHLRPQHPLIGRKVCCPARLNPAHRTEPFVAAYRDLTKVWHPDRFDDGDTRLKQKAEEQLKVIKDAYARIQVAHKCINHR